MEHILLCKAKRKDNNEWVEGFLFYCLNNGVEWCIGTEPLSANNYSEIIGENIVWFPIDEQTICRYTGSNDKYGKKIWENDVACTPYIDPIFGDMVNNKILDDYTWKVVYTDSCFCLQNEDKLISLRSFTSGNNIKVVGNVFDDLDVEINKEIEDMER